MNLQQYSGRQMLQDVRQMMQSKRFLPVEFAAQAMQAIEYLQLGGIALFALQKGVKCGQSCRGQLGGTRQMLLKPGGL